MFNEISVNFSKVIEMFNGRNVRELEPFYLDWAKKCS